jgi:hypothetical protein
MSCVSLLSLLSLLDNYSYCNILLTQFSTSGTNLHIFNTAGCVCSSSSISWNYGGWSLLKSQLFISRIMDTFSELEILREIGLYLHFHTILVLGNEHVIQWWKYGNFQCFKCCRPSLLQCFSIVPILNCVLCPSLINLWRLSHAGLMFSQDGYMVWESVDLSSQWSWNPSINHAGILRNMGAPNYQHPLSNRRCCNWCILLVDTEYQHPLSNRKCCNW